MGAVTEAKGEGGGRWGVRVQIVIFLHPGAQSPPTLRFGALSELAGQVIVADS